MAAIRKTTSAAPVLPLAMSLSTTGMMASLGVLEALVGLGRADVGVVEHRQELVAPVAVRGMLGGRGQAVVTAHDLGLAHRPHPAGCPQPDRRLHALLTDRLVQGDALFAGRVAL